MTSLHFSDFPHQTFDKIRYNDTDRQGHVNNANFARYYETGRVEMLIDLKRLPQLEHDQFVIVDLHIQFKQEILWPGQIDIGSKITKIGNSSIYYEQALFQNGALCSTATSVIVYVDGQQKKAKRLPDDIKTYIAKWLSI
jgi:acyl-CoA thioester hydrolase